MAETAVVVGAGGISGAWFPPLAAEGVHVAAVVDIDPERARSQIDKYTLSAEATDDLSGALAKYAPDFVVDLTTPEAHCEVTCTALEAGCHVVGEKPMATSMEEARRQVATSERTGKLYMVSQSRRWNATHDSVRRTVAARAVGEVTTLNCDFYIGAHFGGFRDEMDSPLILDMSIHHFDLARFLTGLDAVSVYCQEFNPKGSWYKGDVAASCVFEMTEGVVFTYRGSWCAEGCHTSWNGDWRIIGDRGTLLYEKDAAPYGQAVTGEDGFHRTMGEAPVEPSPLEHSGQHGALRELLRFIRTGEPPQCECHDNIKSLAMVLAAIESSRTGQRVNVPLA